MGDDDYEDDSAGDWMRYTLVGITVVTFIAGLIVLGLGAWVWTNRSFYSALLSNNLFIASLAMVVLMGVAVMLLSVIGCCGAAYEIRCLLFVYCIVVSLIFLVILVAVILQFTYRKEVVSTIEQQLYRTVKYYGVKHEYTKSWDETQKYLKCCGVRGSSDWNNIPASCCKESSSGKRMNCKKSPNPTTMHVKGCLSKIEEFLKQNELYVGAVAITLSVLLLPGMIVSCCLIFY